MLNQKEKKQILHIILLTLGGLMILFGTLLFFLTPIPTETLLNTSFHNYQWTGLEIILLKIAALFTAFWGIILVKIAKKPEQNLFLVHLTIVFFTLTLLTQFWALSIPIRVPTRRCWSTTSVCRLTS